MEVNMLGELIINGLLLPGATVVVFLVVAARTGHEWLQALAVGAALIAASIGLSGLPQELQRRQRSRLW
jgi:hypothetical protein